MPPSAWFKFKTMVEQLRKDYPANFLDGPSPRDPNAMDDAILTWDDDGHLLVAFPCNSEIHSQLQINPRRLHRHINGFWYVTKFVQTHPTAVGEVQSH